ncbi:MAG: TIGR03757 family integrating conjugative element protein [Gammaproteobacteria bacterium]|nr:TIGR03757 family integrating conjugative element protein [Gammaproteobacteria bacterium]
MRVLAAWLLPWLPLIALAANPGGPARIDIFTHMGEPVANVAATRQQLGDPSRVQYFAIDAQVQLDAALSEELPPDPEEAREIVLERIQRLDRSQLARALQESYEGLLRARRYGLDRIPAIVFDGGESVVYGVTDLQAALRLHRQHRKAQPK